MDERMIRRLGWAAIAVSVAAMLPTAFGAALHCDEANVIRHVTSFGNGNYRDPGRPGLLWWLLTPALKAGTVEAVYLLRAAALLASTVTLVLVWKLAARAAGPLEALAAVLLLGTSMSWQAHSFEVRTDTFVVPVTLAVIWLLWTKRSWRGALAIGLLVAVAGLFSQKSIYNAVAIAAGWGVLFATRGVPRRLGVPIVASAVAALCVGAWYAGLAAVNADDVVGSNLTRAASNAWEESRRLTTNLGSLGRAANRAWLLYWGLIPGAVVAWRRRNELLAMVAVCAVMVATIFVHRGFFMYFIASFEPYFAVVSGAGVVALVRALPRPRLVAGALGLAVLATAVLPYRGIVQTSWSGQMGLIQEIDAAFPEPVPYWDGVGLVPGYPETTRFLTGATRKGLRRSIGDAAFIQLAKQKRPHLFVRDYMTRDRHFKPAERRWLWKHFVPYRPNLYLGGGRLRVRAKETIGSTIDLLVPGEYTVWFHGGWTGEATVAGVPVEHQQVVTLDEGGVALTASAARGSGQLWLMLGADRVPYAESTDDLTDYSMYPLLTRKRFQQYDRPGHKADLLSPPHDPVLRTEPPADRTRRRRDHATWHQMFDARNAKLLGGQVLPIDDGAPNDGRLAPPEGSGTAD